MKVVTECTAGGSPRCADFRAANMNSVFFYGVTSCGRTELYQHYGKTCCLHLTLLPDNTVAHSNESLLQGNEPLGSTKGGYFWTI